MLKEYDILFHLGSDQDHYSPGHINPEELEYHVTLLGNDLIDGLSCLLADGQRSRPLYIAIQSLTKALRRKLMNYQKYLEVKAMSKYP